VLQVHHEVKHRKKHAGDGDKHVEVSPIPMAMPVQQIKMT
jgi:hypothetical protein